MRSFASVLALFVLLGNARLEAQIITDGTDPTVGTELMNAGNMADWRSQTFVAQGPYLQSLSFWFYGGTRRVDVFDFYSRLYINTGLGFSPEGPLQIFREALDQTRQGRYDFSFPYLPLVTGAFYTFSIFTNNCGSDCGTDSGGPPITGTHRNPFIEVTTSDAYAGGYLIHGREGPYFSQDIRFEISYGNSGALNAVPEPSTVILLGTGLLALGFVAWRRKEEED